MKPVAWTIIVCLAPGASAATAAPIADPQPAAALTSVQSDLARAVFAPRPKAGAPFAPETQLPTAVSRKLDSDRVIGQLGYLCGLDSEGRDLASRGGPASSFDKVDTFLGAKLTIAIR